MGEMEKLSLEHLTVKMTMLLRLALKTVLPDYYRQLEDSIEFTWKSIHEKIMFRNL